VLGAVAEFGDAIARSGPVLVLEAVAEFGDAIARQLVEHNRAPSATTVTDIHGIGPLGAAIILGHTGDIARFPTSGHFARYTGTAPIAASSGPTQRHRLNPRGNRQLNRALHVAAVTQVRNDTPGSPRPNVCGMQSSPSWSACARCPGWMGSRWRRCVRRTPAGSVTTVGMGMRR
jgi:hypothetical protein